jgi:WD40 repeat protein
MDERWECQLTIPDAHERTIYSISWGEACAAGLDSATELGWLASAGGDGATRIWRVKVRNPAHVNSFHPLIDAATNEINGKLEPEGSSLGHELLAHLPETHGDADVNAVSWCPKEGLRDLIATVGDDRLMRVFKVVPSTDHAS